jgi:carbon storage regulator CsrA
VLILTRRVGETVMVGDEVTVTVLGAMGHPSEFGYGLAAEPEDLPTHRGLAQPAYRLAFLSERL